jgi:two-component system response regulator GlrR
VLFDCGAAGPAGAEAQLFGGTTDSLGDATTRRRGLIEAAHGGTLVLDDVGALPMAAQSALVRLLDRGEVVAVGGIEAVPADVRIIAVSQQDLRDLVARNAFRRDLCDRLQTVSITLPPLRERRGDIPLLASHFARQLAHDAPPLGVEVMERFTASEWPGNVRELRNAVERELFLVQRPPRDSEVRLRPDLAAFMESLFDEPIKDAQDAWTGRFMRAYLANALELSGGSVSGAARLVGTNRRYIQRLMRRYGIRSADCRIILAREALTG